MAEEEHEHDFCFATLEKNLKGLEGQYGRNSVSFSISRNSDNGRNSAGNRNSLQKNENRNSLSKRNSARLSKNSFKFDYDIELVLDEPEARECFREFLRNVHTEEPLTFIESVEDYKRKLHFESMRRRALQIIQKFINEGSSNEINIGSEVRRNIKANFDLYFETDFESMQGNDRKIFVTLFDEAFDHILQTLRKDLMQRFIRSKTFEKFLSIHPQIMPLISVQAFLLPLESSALEILPQDIHSKETSITYKDFQFFDALSKDSLDSWKLFCHKENVAIYTGLQEFQLFDNLYSVSYKAKFTKVQCVFLDCGAESLVHTLCSPSEIIKHDPLVHEIKGSDFKSANKDKHQFGYISFIKTTKAVASTKPRELIHICCIYYDTHRNRYIIILKSTQHLMHPYDPSNDKKQKYKRVFLYGAIIVEPISDTSCRYVSIQFLDLKTKKSSSKLEDFIIEKRFLAMISKLKEQFGNSKKKRLSVQAGSLMDDKSSFIVSDCIKQNRNAFGELDIFAVSYCPSL